MQIRGNIHVLRLISYAHRAKQHRQTCFLNIKFNLSHKQQLLNVQFNVCSVMCYTVHWFYWHDKTNASICIRICQILISRHSHMQILTSFSTSLPWIYQQTSRTNIC